MTIEPIGYLSSLSQLPVWVDKAADDVDPEIYHNLFWEIEPWGEYLYYLAGDYEKNEKGLLRFDHCSTGFRVEVNFEDDVIAAAKHDGKIYQQMSIQDEYFVADFRSLKVGEIQTFLIEGGGGVTRWLYQSVT